MIETLGWYKNQWLDIDRIFIAANNRGLKFADGIFETILIKENKPVLFDEHLKRLEKSSKILNINLKINKLTTADDNLIDIDDDFGFNETSSIFTDSLQFNPATRTDT